MPDVQKAEDSKPTDEQVAGAFQALFGTGAGRDEEPEPPAVTVAVEPEEVAETETVESKSDTAEAAAPPDKTDSVEDSEDVKALKLRLTEVEKERDSNAERASKGLEWSRSLALRKSSEADRYKGLLKQIAEGKEVERAEVERLLAQPAQEPAKPGFFPVAQPAAPQDENLALEAEQFVMDYRLTDAKADAFKAWMGDPKSGLSEKDVVPGSLYHTLVLAWNKYEKASTTPNSATVRAVKTLARVQKDAARAAGGITSRARPSPTQEPEEDLMKLAREDPEKFRSRVNLSDLMQRAARGE